MFVLTLSSNWIFFIFEVFKSFESLLSVPLNVYVHMASKSSNDQHLTPDAHLDLCIFVDGDQSDLRDSDPSHGLLTKKRCIANEQQCSNNDEVTLSENINETLLKYGIIIIIIN